MSVNVTIRREGACSEEGRFPERYRPDRYASDNRSEQFRKWRETRRGFITSRCTVALLATSLLLATPALRAQYSSYPDAEWIDGGGLSPQEAAVVTPDGHYVISATHVGDVIVWDIAGRHLVRYLRRGLGTITCMNASWSRNLLAIGTGTGTIREIDATTGADVRTIDAHTTAVADVKFSADERYMVSGGAGDLRVVLWDAGTGDSLATFTGNKSYINDVAISPDGRYVASAGSDFTARVWNTQTGLEIRTFVWAQRTVDAVAFSPDGLRLAAADEIINPLDGEAPDGMKIFDLATGAELSTWRFAPRTREISFSTNGRQIISCNVYSGASPVAGCTVFTLDSAGSITSAPRLAFGDNCTSVQYEPGDTTACMADESGAVFEIEFNRDEHGALVLGATSLTAHLSVVTALAASDDSTFVTGSHSGRIATWNLDDGHGSRQIVNGGYEVRSVAWSPDERTLATCAMDGAIKLWDLSSAALIRTLFASADYSVNDAAWSPDGTRVAGAVGPLDSVVVIFDTASIASQLRLVGHTGGLWAIVWAPDGRTIATGGDDGAVRFWNAITGATVAVATGHEDRVTSLALSPDGHTLASASVDKTIRLWSVPSGDPIGVLRGHTGAVTDVAYTPDGSHVVSCSDDGTIRVWDVGSRTETYRYDDYPYLANALAVTADGKHVIAACDDGSVVSWRYRAVAEVPSESSIASNAVVPNPFRDRTSVSFVVQRAGRVSVALYDLNGRMVERVFDGQMTAGAHSVEISGLSAGAYVYRVLSAGSVVGGVIVCQ